MGAIHLRPATPPGHRALVPQCAQLLGTALRRVRARAHRVAPAHRLHFQRAPLSRARSLQPRADLHLRARPSATPLPPVPATRPWPEPNGSSTALGRECRPVQRGGGRRRRASSTPTGGTAMRSRAFTGRRTLIWIISIQTEAHRGFGSGAVPALTSQAHLHHALLGWPPASGSACAQSLQHTGITSPGCGIFRQIQHLFLSQMVLLHRISHVRRTRLLGSTAARCATTPRRPPPLDPEVDHVRQAIGLRQPAVRRFRAERCDQRLIAFRGPPSGSTASSAALEVSPER